MLNTVSIQKKNNNNSNIIINNDVNVIDESIRKIEENVNDIVSNEVDIIKSFHNQEQNIFANDLQANLNGETFKLKNFNLDEITKQYIDDKSNKVIMFDNKKILISLNESLKKISFYDEGNKLLGFFTIEYIVKYLADIYDTKRQFMTDINEKTFKEGKELIKSFFYKLKINKQTKYVDIMLYDYTQSPMMGDIELLVKINELILKYHSNQMQNDLSQVDKSNKKKIEKNINKFVLLLLNYILKLISIVSEKLKDQENKKQLREQLLKYSIIIIYKINMFVAQQQKDINEQNKSIKNLLESSIELKNDINRKLQDITNMLKNNTNTQLVISKSGSRKPLHTSSYRDYRN